MSCSNISLPHRLFSKPHVYDLDSVGGCACGFGYGPYDLENLSDPAVPAEIKDSEVADYETRRASVRRLQVYLRSATQTGAVEVYSCWIGDEEAVPEMRLGVTAMPLPIGLPRRSAPAPRPKRPQSSR